ncbi:MAG: OmpH family outer membrane protein [Pirellulales bacterium]|nr:OmpH family outer membrane protein [Pirellulales bacterium]
MRPATYFLGACGVALAATIGCGKFTGGEDASAAGNASGNVAIIDLDVVAQQLGYDSQMANAIGQQKASLEKQLGVIKTSFEQDLAKTKNQLGANPTQEQSQQWAHSQRVAAALFHQEQQKASQLLNRYSSQVVAQFRGTVKTTARQVAAERGLSIILTKNEGVVFDYDLAVDITDAVVERMRAEQPDSSAGAATRDEPPSPPVENQAADHGRS